MKDIHVLKANPVVSLLVHDSCNLATDIRQAMAVSVSAFRR